LLSQTLEQIVDFSIHPRLDETQATMPDRLSMWTTCLELECRLRDIEGTANFPRSCQPPFRPPAIKPRACRAVRTTCGQPKARHRGDRLRGAANKLSAVFQPNRNKFAASLDGYLLDQGGHRGVAKKAAERRDQLGKKEVCSNAG
jgi:hypothetical protein